MLRAALVFISLIVAGCTDDYDTQIERLDKFVRSNKVGVSKDVWLLRTGPMTQNERVALIFGYVDDLTQCQFLAEQLAKREAGLTFSCMYAN